MKHRLLFFLATFSTSAYPQPWSTFLDSSRAIDWSSAGFTIPNYTVNCSAQPSLTANSPSAASANTTAIQNALASCDATHNVINIPAGTYYVAGWKYGTQGHQVVRGAGPTQTYLYITTSQSCGGFPGGVCMQSSDAIYDGDSSVLPSGGSRQCAWTAGLTKGSTNITLSNCGGVPPAGHTIVLDQANDSSDTNGIYVCDSSVANCSGESPGSYVGRSISGKYHTQAQVTQITAVTSLGSGSYSVTISPPVYFNNIRSGQIPGAYWNGFVQNLGLENLTIDRTGYYNGDSNLVIYNADQCWVKNIRSMYAGRNHIWVYLSSHAVIRDSYFYQNQSHASVSYGIEFNQSSGTLVENNIFQQITFGPTMFGPGSGTVIGYNLVINNAYTDPNFSPSNASHSTGSGMNLWEGNVVPGINSDDSWGGSSTGTWYRNLIPGWATGKTQYTYPVSIENHNRAFNLVGNILGQPGYQTHYESYATSASSGVNGGDTVNTTIYVLGWSGYNGWGGCQNYTGASPGSACDPLVRSTLMRWGNWDVVTNGTKWDPTEASPAGAPYVSANFGSSYFNTLAHTLPASLYYSVKPSWWPASKAWPPIGPDVSSGNLGMCTGTFSGTQATASGQCTGGALNIAWASHVNSLPAQDCYLNVMHGALDGTGNVLTFDANACYVSSGSGSGPAVPTQPAVTVQ